MYVKLSLHIISEENISQRPEFFHLTFFLFFCFNYLLLFIHSWKSSFGTVALAGMPYMAYHIASLPNCQSLGYFKNLLPAFYSKPQGNNN